ncbi:MAG: 2-amino-4-hydroxy-6-hydroxymethyldihydropteridine diphosphokinase [Candidatus Aminicenantaceae bacterium]
MAQVTKYFLSLGTNLGQKKNNLSQALSLLEKKGVRILRSSSIYRTQPIDFHKQPWFYNQVVEVESSFSPLEFLRVIKNIEKTMGRRTTVKKGPRIIDIDILLAEKIIIKARELVIPHPLLEKRNFVLIPLRELSPHAIHPLLGTTIDILANKSEDKSIVKKLR